LFSSYIFSAFVDMILWGLFINLEVKGDTDWFFNVLLFFSS
jgi:hypothetical protein